MLRKLQGVLPLAGALLLLLAAGYWMLFSHFAFFDDEGYILLSARSYLEHGHLYTDVYSQYGPSFYVSIDGLHRLTGLAVDNFARLLTLVLWLRLRRLFRCDRRARDRRARARAVVRPDRNQLSTSTPRARSPSTRVR